MPRTMRDFIADTIEGKLAEEAMRMFLEVNYGILMNIDYDIYPDEHQHDFGNDVRTFVFKSGSYTGAFAVDVKGARHNAQWLLVESYKFGTANAYVLVTIEGLNLDWEEAPENSMRNCITANVNGFAYSDDFINQQTKKPWIQIPKGKHLPEGASVAYAMRRLAKQDNLTHETLDKALKGIRTLSKPMKAKLNYGMPKGILRHSGEAWDQLVKMVVHCRRPADDYIWKAN